MTCRPLRRACTCVVVVVGAGGDCGGVGEVGGVGVVYCCKESQAE